MTLTDWLLSVLVLELIAILTVAYLAFSGFFTGMRILSKVGIFVMTSGLMVQIMRSLYYFENGSYPIDNLFPLWITKDIGASIIIFDLALLYFKRNKSCLE
jgi:hypothetical protein